MRDQRGNLRMEITNGDVPEDGTRRPVELAEGKLPPYRRPLLALLTEDEEPKLEMDAPRANETNRSRPALRAIKPTVDGRLETAILLDAPADSAPTSS